MSTINPKIRDRILKLYDRNWNWKRIARSIRVSPRTVRAVKAQHDLGPKARRAAARKAWNTRRKLRTKQPNLAKVSLTALTGLQANRKAYQLLARRLTAGARRVRSRVGWHGGSREVIASWHQKLGFWVVLSPTMNRGRYWIGFGLQNPNRHRTLGITCEINPSRLGFDRSCAGVLMKDSDGNIVLGHSGKIGGGRAGVGKQAFLKDYRGKTQQVAWGQGAKRTTSYIIALGKIAHPRFLLNLSKFLVDVDRFKENVTSGPPDMETLLRSQQEKAEADGLFDPENLADSRRRNMASIVSRRGQRVFRRRLLKEYNGQCAITGCNCTEALEAAHIQPYLGVDTNHITNGLLLRSDLHVLFDLRRVSITDDYKLLVSKNLKNTVYWELHGTKLAVPHDPSKQPNRKVLAEHRAGMIRNQKSTKR